MSDTKPPRCVGCPLEHEAGPVWGCGPKEPGGIVAVGEAPGTHETQYSKRPFTGGSGRLLRGLASQAGLAINKVYLTNSVKCRPIARDLEGKPILNSKGEPKDRPPTKEELNHCRPFLEEELRETKPNLIIALGATALYSFKDNNQIGKYRGIPFVGNTGTKVLATFHPAALMRQQHMFPAFFDDIRAAVKEAKSPNLHVVDVQYTYPASHPDDAAACLRDARKAGWVSFDWETTGFSARTSTYQCAGVTSAPHTARSFVWSPSTQKLMEELFSDPSIEKVGQNSEDFDIYYWLEKGNPEPAGKTFDTMLGFHLVNPDLPKKLEGIASHHARDIQPWKGPQMYQGSLKDLQHGNCVDVDVTARGYLAIKQEMKMIGVEDLYYKSVMPLQPVLRKMRMKGVRKNVGLAEMYAEKLREIAVRKESTLRSALGDPFLNINSPQQLMALLYDTLNLPVQYAKNSKHEMRPTANAEAMEKLAELSNDPIFLLVNEIRTARKWASTYCDIETDENDFAHPHFGCAKAGNGRLNSWDFNAQNVPNDLRVIWVPDEDDWVFVSADWSQVEWRIAMALAGDEAGLKLFQSGIDIHSGVAAEVNEVPVDQVDKDLRHQAKFIVYGLAYGREAQSLAKSQNKPTDWAQSFINRFFRKFPKYSQFRNIQENFVQKNNYLRNPFGRRRWWYTRTLTEELNFNPSSTAADMMYLVMPPIDRQLPKDATLRLTIHDELVICTPKDSAREAAQCLRDNMQRVFEEVTRSSMHPDIVRKYYPNGWYAPVEVSFGNNWKQCKEKSPEDKEASHAIAKEVGFQ